ncbi:hypothetical protein OHD26_10740 [Escherichia coli]|nr:hypothetical protein [Escherichia coli]
MPEPPQFATRQSQESALFQAVRPDGRINVIKYRVVGKTATARNYCRSNQALDDHPNTCASSAHGVSIIADASGIDYTRANKGALSRATRRSMGTRRLVIVDEADHLGADGLEQPGQFRTPRDRDGVYW